MLQNFARQITAPSTSVALLISISLFIFSSFYLHHHYKLSTTIEYLGQNQNGVDIDVLDYHFMAVNFALTNKFPVSGYLLKPEIYKIYPYPYLDFFFLDMFRKNGPVWTFVRPPLYPLLTGCIYKIFGVHVYYNQLLNVVIIALLTGFLPLSGYFAWGAKGFYSGIAGGICFLIHMNNNDYLFGLKEFQIFAALILFILFLIGLLMRANDKPAYYLLFGIFSGLGLLATQVVTFVPIVFSGFFLIRNRKSLNYRKMKMLLAMYIGVALIILPWTIYINIVQAITTREREQWISRVSNDMERIDVSDRKYLPYDEALADFIKTMYLYHARTSNFIFLTNGGGEALLHLNNEYCADNFFKLGTFDFSWMMINSSYYRTHWSDAPTLLKVFRFYYDNPSFIIKIPIARLVNSSLTYPLVFWLAAALWGIWIMQQKITGMKDKSKNRLLMVVLLFASIASYIFAFVYFKYAAALLFSPLFFSGLLLFNFKDEEKTSAIYPVIWLSIFLILLFLYGAERFVEIATPVSYICVMYFTLTLVQGFYQHWHNTRQKVS